MTATIEAAYDALRAGRVPTAGLANFATGIESVIDELDDTIDHAGVGFGQLRFLRGGFGSGKTFVARYAQERARERGFATAWLAVSETELRLWKPDDVYHAVCNSLSTPEVEQGALVDVVDRWFSRIEDRVARRGIALEDPDFAHQVRHAIAIDLLGASGRTMPILMARTLQEIHAARDRGDHVLEQALLAWLSGSRQVDASAKRAAGVKGDIGAREALDFLGGLAALIRLAGYSGLVIVIDELETILRTPRASRARSLNALRQLGDAVDSLPGVTWLVTGTPELFESPLGVAGLAPLHDRIRLLRAGERSSMRQPQIELPPFDVDRLVAVGERVASHFPARRPDFDRSLATSWIPGLVELLSAGFNGRVDVVPRRFLRELVLRLDLHDEDPAFDPAASLPAAGIALADDERAALAPEPAPPNMAPPAAPAGPVDNASKQAAAGEGYLVEDVW